MGDLATISQGIKDDAKKAYDKSREQSQENKEIKQAIKKTVGIDIGR